MTSLGQQFPSETGSYRVYPALPLLGVPCRRGQVTYSLRTMIDRTHHFNIVGNSVNLKALEVPAKAPWSCLLPSGPVVVFPPTQAAEACGAK